MSEFDNTQMAMNIIFHLICKFVQHYVIPLSLLLLFLYSDWLKVRVSGRNLDDALNAWYRHQSSDPNTDSCKTLIENNCYYPQCDKTCPKIHFKRSKKSAINSRGMPVKPDSRNKAHNPLRRRRSRS